MSINIIKELELIEKIRAKIGKIQLPLNSEEWAYLNKWPYNTDEVKNLTKGQTYSYDDKELNDSYNCATLLQFLGHQIVTLNEYTYLEVLYSWYYWFTKFLVRFETLNGKNEGLRDAQFKILEAIDIASSRDDGGEVDSDLLEDIENELGFVE